MSHDYAVTVRIESYEYDGEYYLVGEGHDSPGAVFRDVVAEHIHAITETRHIEQYLLDVLNDGKTVPRSEFNGVEAEVECELYVDVYYQRFAFWTNDREFHIDGPHIESEIDMIAVELST